MAVKRKESSEEFIIAYFHPETGEKIIETLSIRVTQSKRKSIGLTVDENASVTLRLPYYVSKKQGLSFAKEHSSWITEKVLSQREKARMRKLSQKESTLTKEQESALKKRYVKAAKEYLPKRCDYYANLLGVSYDKIRIAEQKTRWGSCSSNKTLSFNWKLMLAPVRVQEYVVVHEVCHLLQMNHSKEFWNLVESMMPDYKEQRKWLKENGNTLQLS